MHSQPERAHAEHRREVREVSCGRPWGTATRGTRGICPGVHLAGRLAAMPSPRRRGGAAASTRVDARVRGASVREACEIRTDC
jgi:hypothetical protein